MPDGDTPTHTVIEIPLPEPCPAVIERGEQPPCEKCVLALMEGVHACKFKTRTIEINGKPYKSFWTPAALRQAEAMKKRDIENHKKQGANNA